MTEQKPCDQDGPSAPEYPQGPAEKYQFTPEMTAKFKAMNNYLGERIKAGKPCDPADPCSTAYDLACERNTLDGLWAETKDRLDAALAQVARLRGALEIIVGCFDAAVIEGLYDRMAEQDNQDPGSLHGLIARRILHAEPVARAALAETADTPAPQPADDGWIAWEGGECPVPADAHVEVKFRDGDTDRREPRDWNWRRFDGPKTIVAYCIVGARDE